MMLALLYSYMEKSVSGVNAFRRNNRYTVRESFFTTLQREIRFDLSAYIRRIEMAPHLDRVNPREFPLPRFIRGDEPIDGRNRVCRETIFRHPRVGDGVGKYPDSDKLGRRRRHFRRRREKGTILE